MNLDRDRIIEQALKHELRGAIPPPGPACLDAETLGAWVDSGLEPAAMASAEAHVSTCARCQAMVGAFARANAAVAPVVEESGFRFWKWWLAPLAAGAAAVTIWMVVPEQQEIATAPPAPVAAELTQPRTAAPAPEPAPAATPEQATARRDQAPAREREERLAAGAQENRAQLQDSAAFKKEAPPAAAPAAPAASVALERSGRFAAPMPLGEDITDQATASPLVSWYVGRAGLVILTTDGGKTFTRVNLAEPLDLATVTATDAKSATVVTTTGRRFHTDDGGRTWRPI